MPHDAAALRSALDALVARYDRRWLDSDPLRWPRGYARARDRELVAVVSALLAYGRVASIHRAVAEVLARLGPHPADALAPSRRAALDARLDGFRHRFTAGPDVAWLLRGVAAAWDEAGSLGTFVGRAAAGDEPLRAGLAAWHRLATSVPADADPRRRRARAFLLADPTSGAACKRSLLLARWCVRPDDGLDLGLWTGAGLSPRDLLLPLDTHVHRVVRDLGLTRRRAPDWRTAVEVTRRLAALDPDDPVRYDFALARPGIVGRCAHRFVADVCGACDLAPSCRHGRRGLTSARRSPGSPRTTPSPAPSRRTSAR
ncbi:MAG: TIGR02757 family protein [Planctomycetes bacterium]|nr:TIGR02757 family protein [Planctomycetota bacterium]